MVTSTLKQAYTQRNSPEGLLFHSDRGGQYISNSFRKLLQNYNAEQSFSNSGRPHDNAVAESFFANLKKEELYRWNCASDLAFKKGVDRFILHYNTERPHSTLKNGVPDSVKSLYFRKGGSEVTD